MCTTETAIIFSMQMCLTICIYEHACVYASINVWPGNSNGGTDIMFSTPGKMFGGISCVNAFRILILRGSPLIFAFRGSVKKFPDDYWWWWWCKHLTSFCKAWPKLWNPYLQVKAKISLSNKMAVSHLRKDTPLLISVYMKHLYQNI